MFAFESSVSARAASLVDQHGIAARQTIADAIVAAIRSGDLARAKWWDEVGTHVDALIRDRTSAR